MFQPACMAEKKKKESSALQATKKKPCLPASVDSYDSMTVPPGNGTAKDKEKPRPTASLAASHNARTMCTSVRTTAPARQQGYLTLFRAPIDPAPLGSFIMFVLSFGFRGRREATSPWS